MAALLANAKAVWIASVEVDRHYHDCYDIALKKMAWNSVVQRSVYGTRAREITKYMAIVRTYFVRGVRSVA